VSTAEEIAELDRAIAQEPGKARRKVAPADIEAAAREMVETGGSLNRALLGARTE
jgi:hypothetical protein